MSYVEINITGDTIGESDDPADGQEERPEISDITNPEPELQIINNTEVGQPDPHLWINPDIIPEISRNRQKIIKALGNN